MYIVPGTCLRGLMSSAWQLVGLIQPYCDHLYIFPPWSQLEQGAGLGGGEEPRNCFEDSAHGPRLLGSCYSSNETLVDHHELC